MQPENQEGKRGKTKGYKSFILHRKKDKKRKEALERNKKWAQFSPAEQIAILKTRPGQSKRQVARLEKKIKNESK